MIYTVKIINIAGEIQKRKFNTYREALCYATDYNRVKQSVVLKNQTQLTKFQF